MSELFLGMISGTSVDGVDAVLAELKRDSFRCRRGDHAVSRRPARARCTI